MEHSSNFEGINQASARRIWNDTNKLKLINCVGVVVPTGFWNEFIDTSAQFIGVEAGGPRNSKLHALH